MSQEGDKRTLDETTDSRTPFVNYFLPPPGEGAENCGPGPFSMANPSVVTVQLDTAGSNNIAFERIDGPVMVGSTVEQAMQFPFALGPGGEVFRESGDEEERYRGEIEDALSNQLAQFEKKGEIIMQSSSWTTTARISQIKGVIDA